MVLDRHGPVRQLLRALRLHGQVGTTWKGYAEVEPTMVNFTYDMWLDK